MDCLILSWNRSVPAPRQNRFFTNRLKPWPTWLSGPRSASRPGWQRPAGAKDVQISSTPSVRSYALRAGDGSRSVTAARHAALMRYHTYLPQSEAHKVLFPNLMSSSGATFEAATDTQKP